MASDFNDAAVSALKRADAGLQAQFDPQSTGVQQARQTLDALAAQLKPATPVQLGAALGELRSLRAMHALKPDDAGAPARAASAGGAKP